MAGLLAKLQDLGKEKVKPPAELVAKLVSAFEALEQVKNDDSKLHDKCLESVSKYVGLMKVCLYGDEEADAKRTEAERETEKERRKVLAVVLADEAVKTPLLSQMVKYLRFLDFEVRKDVAQVFSALVRIKDGQDNCPGAHYVLENFPIVTSLFNGYDDASVALNCGGMLRDCLKDEHLAKAMLSSPSFRDFFARVEVPNFEVASDAFSTFKDLLTRHKAVVSTFLSEHYDEFFGLYHQLLKSSNYVTRRQSLKLLGELLLDRSNVKVMVRFVSDVEFLKTMMQLLKDQSRSIQYEAFTVFKVFAANPNKPLVIQLMLSNNKEKLLKYLEDFQSDRNDHDEMFKEEKAVVIKAISNLPPPASLQQAAQPQQQQAAPPPPPAAQAADATPSAEPQ